MDRCPAIDALDLSLASAAAVRDWDLLNSAVSTLAPRLDALAARGPWSAAEMRALARLRNSHELAAAVCREQQLELVEKMAELQNDKAGWSAYAFHHATPLDENPA